jgi:hypothetical protein
MGSKKAPPPPDYSGITAAMQQQTASAQQMQQQQLDWAKEQFAKTSATTDEVTKAALARQNELDAMAREDRQRYQTVFQPLEDSLVQEAQDYSTPARREMEAGAAMADVTNQFNLARQSAQDRLESFGIDPSQVRSGALDISSRVSEAAARAGAGNASRQQTDALGRALRSEAINVGRGYPGQVAQSYSLAGGAGQGAASTEFGNVASGGSTMGTAPQWAGLGTQAASTWGNMLHTGYGDLLDRYKAQNSASSGWGSALGLVGGIGLAAAGAPASTGLGKLWGAIPKFAEGGPVPESMSPSGGVNVDDVPAQGPTGAIQLDGGEFVVPADVVKWKGEEFFQKQITQSREKRKEAPAQPQVRQAIAIAGHPAVRAAVGAPPPGARMHPAISLR